ncbi:MAG TPA: SLBB domain-containing protein, partial [Bacteroidota bacterium]|nr:SLBB domain-containing protein [Bacteroidota bacterium]
MIINCKTKERSDSLVFRTVCGWMLVFLLCVSTIRSQQQQSQQQIQQSQQLEEKTQPRITMPSTLLIGPALEGAVNPEKYIIGPSDIIAVNIWTLSPVSLDLTVTPEGSLIIPTVGEVSIGGLSLKEAKNTVIAAIKKKYIRVEPTVTLIYPRQLVVKVTGDVVVPGRYVLSSTDRVDNAIQIANKAPAGSEQRLRMTIEMVERTASTRNIRLTRKNGKSVRVDIPKFYASRDDDSNPYLLDGDEVFVPRTDGSTDAIGVYGGVNAPSRFEYARGDNVIDAIELAHGFTVRAISDSVILSRFSGDGYSLHDTVFNYDEMKNGRAPNIALEPGDRIVVHEKYDARGDYRVTVEGEVVYPGTYAITRDRTKLTQVIRDAGGFTEYAALKAAQITRSTTVPEELF